MKTSTITKSVIAATGTLALAGAAQVSANTVTVKAGDTLNKIASANGTTVDALAKANNISNVNLIFVGQTLQTTTSTTTTSTTTTSTTSTTSGTYVVKSGDTLNKIAAANNTTVSAIAAANNIQNVNYISVGQTLKLSSSSSSSSSNTSNSSSSQTNTSSTTNNTSNQNVTPAANSQVQALLNSLNAKRASLGLNAVSLDAGLTARAQARALNAVANGGLPVNHFSTNGEVVAIGWGINQVIDAWYNETNMITNGTPGHRMWVANARATSVGFGIVGGTIVAESNVGQY
ncbi:LysM peptidoglycan-binding domain-containing protein [Leuconostoc falkenbergense]|uniref:LysM peptidoglycan-binding domain-containing protein n=1 Tax=Leuconostoc falkenbergense TaxID=2766470 RepID=UPI0024ADDC09|nr:LysM peptidoglycan-binding domain-containing protein [Leuconostoc falkenbergense]MDI6667983.1 LysM peptidoglycan-binding domain-containing protein [Leuconostoc falkenbergense]